MLIHLHIVYGFFHDMVAELSSCDTDCKARTFIMWPFIKSVSNPDLSHWSSNGSMHQDHLEGFVKHQLLITDVL